MLSNTRERTYPIEFTRLLISAMMFVLDLKNILRTKENPY